MNLRQNKVTLQKYNSHHHLWLSFIVILFIFATSVSAYFLVQKSQDIRKSASDPYVNDCTCIYNSACSVVNMKPCEGQCNPTCNYPAICCQPTKNLCTPGDRACIGDSQLSICKADGSGYTITDCASGTSCDSQQKACITIPTTNPSPAPSSTPVPVSCTANGGDCVYNSDCGVVNRYSLDGTCPPPSICCGDYFEDQCDKGNSYCVDDNTVAICKADLSGYVIQGCATNSICDSDMGGCKSVAPISTCEGTCYTNSSCSAIGKATASGTCRQSTSICCKEADCQGSCYANTSSCGEIGRDSAPGSCVYSTSACCQEASSLVQAGSLELGDRCEDSNECASGNCNNTYINNVGDIVYLGANYFVCVPPTAEQEQDKVQQSQNAVLLGSAGAAAAATMVAVPMVAASLPVLTPLGAYSYATATLATAPAWVQTGVAVAGVTAGWAGVAAGSIACVKDANSDACMAYIASLMADPTGITTLANATDDLINAGVRVVNNSLNQQVSEMLDVDVHFGSSQSNIQDVTDYFYPDYDNYNNGYIIGDQMKGEVYSQAVEDVSNLAQSYINGGMNTNDAIARATNDIMPDYYVSTGPVPADKARSLEQLVSCEGGRCRHYSQLATPVANNMGLDADMVFFTMDTPSGSAGHAVTLIKNSDGSFGIIDATNPHLTSNNVTDFLNKIGIAGWNPTSNMEGAIQGYGYQIIN